MLTHFGAGKSLENQSKYLSKTSKEKIIQNKIFIKIRFQFFIEKPN